MTAQRLYALSFPGVEHPLLLVLPPGTEQQARCAVQYWLKVLGETGTRGRITRLPYGAG